MKRKIMILFALGCMTVLGAGAVTYAYLTDDDVKQNEIRAAENKVHIEEEFKPPEDPQPGDVIVKKPVKFLSMYGSECIFRIRVGSHSVNLCRSTENGAGKRMVTIIMIMHWQQVKRQSPYLKEFS